MAAQLNPAPTDLAQVVDLRTIGSRDLAPLLEEETESWREQLEWDFGKSAELVRRYVDLHVLGGVALVENGAVTGYGYFVVEEDKVLIGDLYVRSALRTAERGRRAPRIGYRDGLRKRGREPHRSAVHDALRWVGSPVSDRAFSRLGFRAQILWR